MANKAMENKIRGAFTRAVPDFPEELFEKCSEQEKKAPVITKQKNNRRYFKPMVAAAILVVALTLGATVATMGNANYETLYYNYLSGTPYYKNGMFQYSEGLSVLQFFNFDTMEATPICTDPTCPHTDPETCAAIGINGKVFIYDDKLWWLKNEPVYDENWQRYDHIVLYSAKLNGKNRRKVAELDGVSAYSNVYVKNGKLYFDAVKTIWVDEGVPIAEGEHMPYRENFYLYSYDFKQKEFTELYAVEEVDGWNEELSIIGRYGDSLAFYVSQKFYDSTQNQLIPQVRYMFYDFNKGKFTEYDKEIWCAQKDWLVSKDDDGTIVVNRAYSGEEYRITDERFTQAFWGSYCVFDGMLMCPGDGYAYELKTGKVHTMQPCGIVAYYKGKYIVWLPSSVSGILHPETDYVVLKKNDLLLD